MEPSPSHRRCDPRRAHRRNPATPARPAVHRAVPDTTTLDRSHHPGATALGPLTTSGRQGMPVHTTLAVTTDSVPLGLLDRPVETRDPTATGRQRTRQQRPTAVQERHR
ncbi:MAG: hypothetical protein NZ699_04185 [Roseiflexus sp.]|nr:hypothetical protein [Roseiflexus sp.]MDW8148926.1 hypothetical protein [Roseiflexaceae bacterium]